MSVEGVAMRRVVRGGGAHDNVVALAGEKRIRLVALLEDWADWCRRFRLDLGYPNRAACCASGGGVVSSDHVYDGVDAIRMQAVDAVVGDLPPNESAAIIRRYGMAAVFRFSERCNYEESLERAHVSLTLALPRKGVVF